MELTKKSIYLSTFILFLITASFVLQKQAWPDSDYALLLKTGINLEDMNRLNILFFFFIPAIIYLVSVYILKADKFYSFIAAILFATSGISVHSFFSIAPMISELLGEPYDVFYVLKLSGVLLPLGVIAIAEYKKKVLVGIIGLFALVSLPFFPACSLVLFSILSSQGLGLLENEQYKNKALMFIIFTFVFIQLYRTDLVEAFSVAVFCAIVLYIALSIHKLKTNDILVIILIFFIFNIPAIITLLSNSEKNTLYPSEIEGFKKAGELTGAIFLFDYPHAFEYYCGKKANLMNASLLLKKTGNFSGYLLFSGRALDNAYQNQPLVFKYNKISDISQTDRTNKKIVTFVNNKYWLNMFILNDELIAEDAYIGSYEKRTGALIPFTKIKQLFKGLFNDTNNRMINTNEIRESILFSILFEKESIYDNNGTRIVVLSS